MKHYSVILMVSLVGLTACERSPISHPPDQSTETRPKIVACDLVTKEEVSAIQGAKMIAATSSEGGTGALFATQCYYSSAEPNKSVNIAAIQKEPGPGANLDPRDYWKEKFVERAPKDEAEKDRGKGEEGEKEPALRKINGLGDDAYWAPARMGGILYVLKGDVFLRISVGGGRSEQEILDKSKELATKALSRL
jgi:hypothetical protein